MSEWKDWASLSEERYLQTSEISQTHVGSDLRIAGWVVTIRDHGDVVFVELDDGHGRVQVLCESSAHEFAFKKFKNLKIFSTIGVEGRWRVRPEGNSNPHLTSGDHELLVSHIDIFSLAKTLPFPLDDESVSEKLQLKYRYLQLRSPSLRSNLKLRAHWIHQLRCSLIEQGFLEIETPVLFRPTSEGAREFCVPSRAHLHRRYSLSQSPQILKQLLMISGFNRYMQLAKCFRDEDLRADRQPEFTQMDLECSFMHYEHFKLTLEKCFLDTLKEVKLEAKIKLPTRIQSLPFAKAMLHYASDKPDIRYPFLTSDIKDQLKETQLDVFRKILLDPYGNAKPNAVARVLAVRPSEGADQLSRTFLDNLQDFARSLGGKGLAWIRVQADGSWQGPAGKFFTSSEKLEILNTIKNTYQDFGTLPNQESFAHEGTMLFFCIDSSESQAQSILSGLRSKVIQETRVEPGSEGLLWITDWPMFLYDPDLKQHAPAHHPFTSPRFEDFSEFMSLTPERLSLPQPIAIQAQSYDLVWNGWEIGGGSARIHMWEMQHKMFELLGKDPNTVESEFGFFTEALRYGVPPHCGMAIGVDRVTSILCGENSIRNLIAFPKNGAGICAMSSAPVGLQSKDLKELGLKLL